MTLSITVAGRTEAEASLLLAEIRLTVDGAQPQALGWNCGALVPHQAPRVYPDDLDLPGPSARAFVGVASWRCVVADLPTS